LCYPYCVALGPPRCQSRDALMGLATPPTLPSSGDADGASWGEMLQILPFFSLLLPQDVCVLSFHYYVVFFFFFFFVVGLTFSRVPVLYQNPICVATHSPSIWPIPANCSVPGKRLCLTCYRAKCELSPGALVNNASSKRHHLSPLPFSIETGPPQSSWLPVPCPNIFDFFCGGLVGGGGFWWSAM